MNLGRRVTYLDNHITEGRPPVDERTYLPGEMVVILDAQDTLRRAGYCFESWNTNADGTGTPYRPGDTVTMGNADGFLYAVWVPSAELVEFPHPWFLERPPASSS